MAYFQLSTVDVVTKCTCFILKNRSLTTWEQRVICMSTIREEEKMKARYNPTWNVNRFFYERKSTWLSLFPIRQNSRNSIPFLVVYRRPFSSWFDPSHLSKISVKSDSLNYQQLEFLKTSSISNRSCMDVSLQTTTIKATSNSPQYRQGLYVGGLYVGRKV